MGHCEYLQKLKRFEEYWEQIRLFFFSIDYCVDSQILREFLEYSQFKILLAFSIPYRRE
jgi:hypothetical protein